MNKKKVVHISQATGGVKTYVAHILEYANPDAFEFVVIAPHDEIFERFCANRGIPYYAVDLHRGNNPVKNIGVLFHIISILKKEKPDIIHTHSAKGGLLGRLAARFTKTKVLYTPHAFSYLSFTGISRIGYYLLELIARKWSNILLAISYSEANRAIYELGYPQSSVKVILNAIPINGRPMRPTANKPIKIRMIGRLTIQKNHLLFLEVARKLLLKYPNLEFSVLGAGIHDDLAKQIDLFLGTHQLQNKIRIESWGGADTSQKFLEDADIFVMTSVFEGLSFSLLEAMSLGIPCVVSKVDGNTDVINNNENGFACLSIEEFYQKIELLVNSAELSYRIGQAGYDYVKTNHSIQANTMQLEKLYAEM